MVHAICSYLCADVCLMCLCKLAWLCLSMLSCPLQLLLVTDTCCHRIWSRLWRMVSLAWTALPDSAGFPPHSPYLTQDFLFVCMHKNSPAESLLIFVFSSISGFFGLNTAFQEGFYCINTAVVEAGAIEEAFKSRRCGVNKYSWVDTPSIQCCSFWNQW